MFWLLKKNTETVKIMPFILPVIYSDVQVSIHFSSIGIAMPSDSSYFKYSFKQAISQNPGWNIRTTVFIKDRQKTRGWYTWKQ